MKPLPHHFLQNGLRKLAHFFHAVLVAGDVVEGLADSGCRDRRSRYVEQKLDSATLDPFQDDLLVTEHGVQELDRLKSQHRLLGVPEVDESGEQVEDVKVHCMLEEL